MVVKTEGSTTRSGAAVLATYTATTPVGLGDASQHPALLELAAALQQLNALKVGGDAAGARDGNGSSSPLHATTTPTISTLAPTSGSTTPLGPTTPTTAPTTAQLSRPAAKKPVAAAAVAVDWGRYVDSSRPEHSGAAISQHIRSIGGGSAALVGLQAKMTTPQHLTILRFMERPHRDKVRDDVLQHVLKTLTSTHGDHVLAASLLAELVSLELVNLGGVATALENLLSDPTTRKAACAVLGKVSQQSKNNENVRKAMSHLDPIVSAIEDPDLEYDVRYISRTMGWQVPRATLTQVRTLSTPHKGAIISSAFCQQRDELVTGSADGLVCVWGAPSYGETPSAQFVLPKDTFPCSMDVAPRGNMLAIGVAPMDAKAPQIQLYPFVDIGKWGSAVKVNRPIGSALTNVKCLNSRSSSFCISERTPKGSHNVAFFASNGEAQVARELTDAHHDYITALSTSPENDTLLLTGARDGSVKIWDIRSNKALASSGAMVNHHSGPITTISTVRDTIATGSLDKKLALWDMRKLSHPSAEKTFGAPILRICCGNQATAVVSTTNSISTLTLDPLAVQDITPNVCYHQLRQNTETSVVYAAGEGRVVDLYNLKVNE